MKYLFAFLIIVLFLCIVLFLALKKIFLMTFASDRKHSDNFRYVPNAPQYIAMGEKLYELIDGISKDEFEDVLIKSYDGLSLFGRLYERERTDVVKLDFHGHRSHAYRDFSGINLINKQLNITSILVDQRSHGKSEGKAICFGIKERFDVLSWVNYVKERFGEDTKIILSGVSMGAATVLMASDVVDEKNVVGIIADCPYSSPRDIIIKVAKDKGLNGKLLFPLVILSAKLFAGIDIDASSPVESVKNTNIPILIIHGDDDRFVPHYMGKAIYEACASENKKFLSVKDAGHALSYCCDTETYVKTTKDFINSVI